MKTKKSVILIAAVLFALGLVLVTGSALAADDITDVDNDKMDDFWEKDVIQINNLSRLGIETIEDFKPDADIDKDGATNLDEFEAGTDPCSKFDGREKGSALILLGVALCIGVPGIMAAFGLYIAGVSAVGMTTEHMDRFGKGLILQALPMTQGVYGLVFAILLLLGAGYIGGSGNHILLTNPNVGWGAVMIGITIGLTSVSAIPQGLVAGAGASGVGRNPDVFAKGVIYAVMPETMAVFGFLIALFILMGVGLL